MMFDYQPRLSGALLDLRPLTAADHDGLYAAASDPALLATDLADYLVLQGVPFRQAHHAVGTLVALAESRQVSLAALSPDDFRSASPAFGPDTLKLFDLGPAMARRDLPGAPGTRQVARQLLLWRRRLKRTHG